MKNLRLKKNSKPKSKKSLFHQYKRLKPQKVTKKADSLSFKKKKLNFFLTIGVIFLLTLFLLYFRLLQIRSHADEVFMAKVSNISGIYCKSFNPQSPLRSFLIIESENGMNLRSIRTLTIKDDDSVSFDLIDTEVELDKAFNMGKLQTFINQSKVYLNEDQILIALQSLFLKQLKYKIDYIIFIENGDVEGLSDFLNYKSILDEPDLADNMRIKTDLCPKALKDFLKESSANLKKESISYSNQLKISDYLSFDEIYKEQLRIELIDLTGIGYQSLNIASYFENYGINVVRTGASESNTIETHIYYDSEESLNSNTMKLIVYLIDYQVTDAVTSEKGAIFSDIRINLGTTSIVN